LVPGEDGRILFILRCPNPLRYPQTQYSVFSEALQIWPITSNKNLWR